MTITITAFKRMTTAQIRQGLPIAVMSSGKLLFNASVDNPVTPTTPTSTPTEVVNKPNWLGEWSGNVGDTVRNIVNATQDTSLFVLYNIPGRDNDNYSAGGLSTPQGYSAWVLQIAQAIGTRKAIVVLEPDALGLSRSLSDQQKTERYAMLNEAIKTLKANQNTKVYVDSSTWAGVDDSVNLLNKLTGLNGFTCNVSGYLALDQCLQYAKAVSDKTSLRFIIDTSRNGYGAPHGADIWCNQTDTKIGMPNTMLPQLQCDAYLWVKVPGESDGRKINGKDGDGKPEIAPNAGTMWPEFRDAIYSGDWAAFKAKYNV